MTLCECGCGEEANEGNRFINGHNGRGEKRTEETRKKMSEACKGRKFSDKHKRKLSEAKKGEKHHMYGKKHTDETKRKLSEACSGEKSFMYGRKLSNETKRKLSEGAKKQMTPDMRRKLSEASKRQKHMKHTPETIKKLSGEKSHLWKGGISFAPYCPKFNNSFKESIREKYGRKCFLCGKSEKEQGRKLDVHHIDYNKEQGCDSHEWRLVPLCRSCHGKTSNGDREYWENLILKRLEELKWYQSTII